MKDKTGQTVTLPDKKSNSKGVSLYEGRVTIKDQATLEITNVTLDNMYILALIYVQNGSGKTLTLTSESVRVIPTGRYWL